MTPEVADQKHVIERIEDWVRRIEALYDEIRGYCGKLPNANETEILDGSMLQTSEELMERFDVRPRMVPTLAVLYGRNRISFAPHGLWIIGANGRINVTTNRHQYILVDQSESGQSSQWKFTTSRISKNRHDFDFEVFKALAEGWEIE